MNFLIFKKSNFSVYYNINKKLSTMNYNPNNNKFPPKPNDFHRFNPNPRPVPLPFFNPFPMPNPNPIPIFNPIGPAPVQKLVLT